MSTDMAARDYFSHTSTDGRSPTQRMADAGYPAYSTWTGEDLAAGYTTAAEVLKGWIESPAHHAVLTNPAYRAIGVGRAYGPGSTYRWYWTADFGGGVGVGPARRPDPAAAPIGVGRAYGPGSTYRWYWTADFGGVVDAATARAPAPATATGFHSRWAGQSQS